MRRRRDESETGIETRGSEGIGLKAEGKKIGKLVRLGNSTKMQTKKLQPNKEAVSVHLWRPP